MRILITGSSGFIGSELVKQLKVKHKLVTFDSIDDQNILDYNNLKEAMNGCDIVIHLAAIPAPVEGKNFSDYFEINCQ